MRLEMVQSIALLRCGRPVLIGFTWQTIVPKERANATLGASVAHLIDVLICTPGKSERLGTAQGSGVDPAHTRHHPASPGARAHSTLPPVTLVCSPYRGSAFGTMGSSR